MVLETNSDFAQQLATIYTAKLNIREAIKQMGVTITNDTPFSGYASKILLIQGGGSPSGNAVTSITALSDEMVIGYILPQRFDASDIANLFFTTTGEDSFHVVFPSTNAFEMIEELNETFIPATDETVSVLYLLFAFAESFRQYNESRYHYDSDWVEFTENGVFLKDRTLVNEGSLQGATQNGVYYSVPLPNRQYYGHMNTLTLSFAKVEVQDG